MADEFDPSLKKKKKKKVIAFDDAAATTTAVDSVDVENVDPTTGSADVAQSAVKPAAGDEVIFEGKKKKKKDKSKAVALEELAAADKADEVKAGADLVDAAKDWPDYPYDEMLDRVYRIMREKNPELAAGEKRKFVMKPPEVLRVGSKRTAFANFMDICRLLKRDPKHLIQFLLAELGTSGSVDAKNCLILKGRFQQKHFESVLSKYIKEYVRCNTCRATDTVLNKDTRLTFLQCEKCGSRRSVVAIRTGFTAITTKRSRVRAAAGV